MNKTADRVIGKPTRYQKNKIKKGKLLNQRFKFKKDDFEEEVNPQIRVYRTSFDATLEQGDALSHSTDHDGDAPYTDEQISHALDEIADALDVADKINLFTGGNTIESSNDLQEAVKQEWVIASHDDGVIISVEDGVLSSRAMTKEEQKEHRTVFATSLHSEHYDSGDSKKGVVVSIEEHVEEGKLAVRAMSDEEQKEHSVIEPIVPPVIDPSDIIRDKLMQRYNDLVIELAMMVADRIKTFKKRNAIMTKLTGEDYGFIEESSWTTGETTTFKYWPASWRFERLIGTSIIFEARFHHTTFELLSYCTVFAPDAKTVITRNGHEYSLDNVDDLQGIIAIYEKAIDFINRKARR